MKAFKLTSVVMTLSVVVVLEVEENVEDVVVEDFVVEAVVVVDAVVVDIVVVVVAAIADTLLPSDSL